MLKPHYKFHQFTFASFVWNLLSIILEGVQTHILSIFLSVFVQTQDLKAWQLMSFDTIFNNNCVREINLIKRETFKHYFNEHDRLTWSF